jgi:hypothetical protein
MRSVKNNILRIYLILDASREYDLEVNGEKNNHQQTNASSAECKTLLATCFHAGILFGFFSGPEDVGDIFLRNTG